MFNNNINSRHTAIPDFNKLITDEMIIKIRNVPYFNDSIYKELNIRDTLLFYVKRYFNQLNDFIIINKNLTIADIGAGFGWLSMAFSFVTDTRIIAVEIDEFRLNAAKKIAKIIGVGEKIDWRIGSLEKLPMIDKEADIVYCIEVLEHIYKSKQAVNELMRISNDLIILTTPNLWFPVIAHDTQLPFCHWLPISIRKRYARNFHRENCENDNLFWSPVSLRRNMKEFKLVSKWLHYKSYQRFKDTFPFYLPYGKGEYVNRLGTLKKIYYDCISKLGSFSHYFTPSLSHVFKRIQ